MSFRLFRQPLRLKIGERELTFASLADFEFSLAGRTDLPAGKISSLAHLSAAEVKEEASRIREIEKRFVAILSDSMETPESLGRQLRELGHSVFSKDHDWRTIIAALNGVEKGYDEFRKLALVKYLQYLGARQDVLKSIYREKRAHNGDEAESPVASALRETVIFDLCAGATPEAPGDTGQFERLPKGETVPIHLQPGREMELRLSNNRFRLVPGAQFVLLDERGADVALQAGKNRVGRDARSEVVINPRYRDVSRTHLIIEPFGPETALFTDLSAHGTYVPVRNLHAGKLAH